MSETKKCPACAEEIKFEAKKCRYCGEEFEKEAKNNEAEEILYEGKVHWTAYIFPSILILFYGLGIYFIFYQKNKKIILSNKKFTYTYGILNKKEFSLKLEKIESIELNKNILDRIFGGGTLIVSGTGGKNEPINNVDNPEEIKKAIEDQINK